MDNWIELLTFFLGVAGAVAGVMLAFAQLIRRTVTFEHKTLKNEGDIARHTKDISRIDEKLNLLSVDVAVIKEQITQINGRFAQVNGQFDQVNARFDQVNVRLDQWQVAVSNSPMTLNEKGQTISKGINAPAFARRYLSNVEVPASADNLQIQEMSFAYASNRLIDAVSAEDRQKLRDYAFNSGHPMSSVLTVIGFEMRDIILKERGFFPDRLKKKG